MSRPLFLVPACLLAACSAETPAQLQRSAKAEASLTRSASPTVTAQDSGTTAGLIAVSPVNARVVWASGRHGTFTRTTDGGATWRTRVVAGAESLQFRDVEGVSEDVAYLLSIGTGTDSRIYKTEDGGATWTLQFQNAIADAFYDCFAFWTSRKGLAFSDSVDGRFPVRRTTDGTTWVDIGDELPPALAGESGFSSSGTCVATEGDKRAWIGTGGASSARVLTTTDGGDSWAAYVTPLRGSPSAGIFSVAFRDAFHGIVGGGDLDPAAPPFDSFARSSDGGRTWTVTRTQPQIGTVFGLAYARSRGGDAGAGGRAASTATVVVTGPGGTAWSADEGDSWNALAGATGFWAVAFADERSGWLVKGSDGSAADGTVGRILKISF